MKSHRQIVESVIKRRQEYLARRKKRLQAICTCICLIVALAGIGFGLQRMGSPKPGIALYAPELTPQPPAQPVKDPDTDGVHRNFPDLTQLSLSQWKEQPQVIWSDEDPLKGELSPLNAQPGQLLFSRELSQAMAQAGEDTIFAVMVDFSGMKPEELLIEGKTAAQWKDAQSKALQKQDWEEVKRIGQLLQQGDAAYFDRQLAVFQEKLQPLGMGVYREQRGVTVYGCIFYTFATARQLQALECRDDEALVLFLAVRFK